MSQTGTDTEGLVLRLRDADRLSEEGRNLEALDILQELERESSHPRDLATLRLKRAIVLTNMGDTPGAQELMSAIDSESLSEEYRLTYKFETGRIEAARGEIENAIMNLTQALRDAETMKLKGDLASVRDTMITLLASLLCDSGQPARAIPLLARIARRGPGWERARRILGDCYFQLSDFKEAVKCYREVLDARDPISELERSMATRNLGFAFFYLRNFRQAAEYLKLAAGRFDAFPALKQEIDDLLRKCSP
jgi:tetratricopeptide (TPR) repeat protein